MIVQQICLTTILQYQILKTKVYILPRTNTLLAKLESSCLKLNNLQTVFLSSNLLRSKLSKVRAESYKSSGTFRINKSTRLESLASLLINKRSNLHFTMCSCKREQRPRVLNTYILCCISHNKLSISGLLHNLKYYAT